MRKTMKHIVLGSAVASTALFGAAAHAGWSANVGAVTNYIWRGVTQTNDGPAIQGGVDYEHASGFYAGTWLSNVDFTSDSTYQELELDLYAGFGGGEDFTWDVGAIYYLYPYTADGDSLSDNGSFAELYFNGGFNILSFGLAYTVVGNSFGGVDCDSSDPAASQAFCEGDIYGYVGVGSEVGAGVGLGATLGYYDFSEVTGDNDSYAHLQLSLTKSDFTFAVDVNDLDGTPGEKDPSAPRFWVGYSKSFDL